MPKSTTPSRKKLDRRLENERLHQLKVDRGGKSLRDLRRANDPTIAEKRAAALQAEQDRLARERALADKAARVQAAEMKAAAARLANERVVESMKRGEPVVVTDEELDVQGRLLFTRGVVAAD